MMLRVPSRLTYPRGYPLPPDLSGGAPDVLSCQRKGGRQALLNERMNVVRPKSVLTTTAALLLLAGCSSDEQPRPTPGTTSAAPSTGNPRGATIATLGEPVQRADGAYVITADNVIEPTGCDTYGEDRSPAETGSRLLLATFTFESRNTPLTGSYLMPTDFYSVTDGTVQPTPNIGGRYQCEDGAEGRAVLHQPLPNSRFVRTERFLVPLGAQFLGYRDPDTRQAFGG